MTSNKTLVSVQDHADVVALVAEGYVKPMAEGDATHAKTAFHPDAIMWGFAGQLWAGGIDPLFSDIDSAGPAPKMQSRIDVLHMTPSMAFVKVELENDAQGKNYTDYLSILKIGGQWKMIAKLWHLWD